MRGVKCSFENMFSGIFPEPKNDPVIQIGNMVICHGDAEPFIRTVFTLNTCAPIVGADVRSHETEKELLEVYVDVYYSSVENNI